jgi:hypothetical protein
MAPSENGSNANPAVSIVKDNQLQESSNGIGIHQMELLERKVAPEIAELADLWSALPPSIQQCILTIARSSARMSDWRRL